MRLNLLIISLSFILFGCNKEPDPIINSTPSTNLSYYPNDSIVANFLYQPGTFWVYKIQGNNFIRDSIFVHAIVYSVDENWIAPISPGQGPQISYHYNYEMILGGNIEETNRYYLMASGFLTNFAFPYEFSTIFYFDGQNDSLVKDVNRVDYFDSIYIQNKWYYDVAKTKLRTSNHSCCPIPDLDYYYINKEFGIIKKEIANPADTTYTIYELVNSNIIK